jgi:hypothetical protein
VLVYLAVYFPFIAILQALTGYDFTAAYAAGGIVSVIELVLGAIIKITELREEKRLNKKSAKAEDEGGE